VNPQFPVAIPRAELSTAMMAAPTVITRNNWVKLGSLTASTAIPTPVPRRAQRYRWLSCYSAARDWVLLLRTSFQGRGQAVRARLGGWPGCPQVTSGDHSSHLFWRGSRTVSRQLTSWRSCASSCVPAAAGSRTPVFYAHGQDGRVTIARHFQPGQAVALADGSLLRPMAGGSRR
jgi:hypothetical protein